MALINRLRYSLSGDYFDTAALATIMPKNLARHAAVSRLLKQGAITKLKRGLYAFGDDYRRRPLSTLAVANIIYGPSYVSLHTMLSYYGLIPEAVHEVTSVNTKHTKLFSNDLGRFSYRIIPIQAFAFGLTVLDSEVSSKVRPYSVKLHDGPATFIAATPEKALLDLLYLTPVEPVFAFVIESLRIELDELQKLDHTLITDLSILYDNATFARRMKRFVLDIQNGD